MTKPKRTCLWLILILPIFWACDDPFEHSRCKWNVVSEQASPDRTFSAELTHYSCKPETDKVYRTRVRIFRANVGPPYEEETVFMAEGKQSIKTFWSDSQNLLVQCENISPGDETFRLDHWGGVTVSFKC